ncbi:MAG: hypothetical protein PWP42_736 [Candidatus Atribacteria bacterium]|nr:hypothetical protein [Candidatus Atribacteria bacterium]
MRIYTPLDETSLSAQVKHLLQRVSMLKSLKTTDVKICRRAGKIEGFYIVKEKNFRNLWAQTTIIEGSRHSNTL